MRAFKALQLALLVAVCLLFAGYDGRAAVDADALKQQIQQRAQHIQEFRDLLNDPDQTIRLAALDAMLKSDDLAMREMAYGICFNSADETMRVVCLKNRLADLQTVTVQVDEIDNPTKQQQKALNDWGGVYSFEIKDYDEKTGQFTCAGGSYRNGKGQVAGSGIEFSQQYCQGSFRLVDGGVLEGDLGCVRGWLGTYPGRIRLQ